MHIRDAFESLHDFWTILQTDEANVTRKVYFIAYIEYFKNTRESKTSPPCLRTLI